MENNLTNLVYTIFEKKNKKLILTIISYLSYNEILFFELINKYFHDLLCSPEITKGYALKGVIKTKEDRILFYCANTKIKNLYNILKKELIDYKIEKNIYTNILQIANTSREDNKKFNHVCNEIYRDINRTFYTQKFVEGNGKAMLINILTALAFIRPEIGYCQGMNFIAGALINLIDNDEEKCFWIFLSFIDTIDLNLLYLKNMPDYSIRVYQLNYYIKEYFPDLSVHFKKQQINPDIFFSKWILTIFSNYLPFEILYKVWDVFIIDKWKAVFKFSLILLDAMKSKLITMDLITLSKFLKDNKENIPLLKFEDISKNYKFYKISNRKLNELREDFFIDQLEAKLENPETEWETDQTDYVTNYKNELNEHLKHFRVFIDKLQLQIKNINIEYQRKWKKYEEKLRIINDLKTKLETQIEVKAGYENVLKRFSNNEIKANGMNKNEGIENKNNSIHYKKSVSTEITSKSRFGFKSKNDCEKLEKKIIALNKEIETLNKDLLERYKKVDKKKINVDKIKKEKDKLTKQLDETINKSEKIKRELIKNLSEKLKLTAKFVSTNQY